MWTPNSKIDLYIRQNGGAVCVRPNGMTPSTQKLPNATISTGYPFISGQGPLYRPTPVLQVPSSIMHQYVTRPVVHAWPFVNQSQHVSVAGPPFVTSTTASPTFNVNRVCSMPGRDGSKYGNYF